LPSDDRRVKRYELPQLPYAYNALEPYIIEEILAIDVWEHAYYLQYKNDRASYVDNWWNVVNWDDVEQRFSKVKR
jgi:Fe-Mn family superoxide dismutase